MNPGVALRMQALMMAGSFTGPALGGVLADALSVRCGHVILYEMHPPVGHGYAHDRSLRDP